MARTGLAKSYVRIVEALLCPLSIVFERTHCFTTASHSSRLCMAMATLAFGFTNSVIQYHKMEIKDTKHSKRSFTLDVDHTELVMVTIIGCLNDTCGL